MWANTPPSGGLIVIGIEDDGTVSGCSKAGTDHINNLEWASGSIFCPEASYDIKHVPAQRPDGEADFLLLIRVLYKRKGRLARTNKGEAYIRLGDKRKKLTPEEIHELEIDRGEIDLEQENSSFEYPEDMDMELVRQFAGNYKSNRKLNDSLSAEEVLALNHLGVLTKSVGFIPNKACALLFAKDPRLMFPGCKIRFLRFDGEHEGVGERFNAVKDIWIDQGPIPRLIVEAEKVMDAQVREFSRLGRDSIFYTAPEYPKQAWYEAIVNACVHRSYGLKNMNIFIKMFDDRLVIESPGGFLPLVTPENIYDTSHPRNPYLFEAMFYLNFVKCAHEGTRRIRDTMAAMNLPMPEFEQKEINNALVRVTLRNDLKHRKMWIDKDAGAVIDAAIFRTLNQDEKRVINFVSEMGNISVSQAHRLTGVKTWHSAKKLLLGLKERGILEDRRNPGLDRDPGARFFLKTQGESNI